MTEGLDWMEPRNIWHLTIPRAATHTDKKGTLEPANTSHRLTTFRMASSSRRLKAIAQTHYKQGIFEAHVTGKTRSAVSRDGFENRKKMSKMGWGKERKKKKRAQAQEEERTKAAGRTRSPSQQMYADDSVSERVWSGQARPVM